MNIEATIHFKRQGKGGRHTIKAGQEPVIPSGRLPRITKLMALAIRFDRLIREGKIKDYAEIARLGHMTRARVTQIMNLLMLAPDIQEQILFWPRVEKGEDPIVLRELQTIAAVVDWNKQSRNLSRE